MGLNALYTRLIKKKRKEPNKMSKQEIITMEYDNLRRARNNRSLKSQYNEMTNDELYAYVCRKWEQILGGEE